MEWLLLALLCLALFAIGSAVPKWWVTIGPLVLAAAVYAHAQTSQGTDSDGVPNRN